MNKNPRIETLEPKKLVGHSIKMSLIDNKTFELFSGFMPNRKHITHAIGNNVYEVTLYKAEHFKSFSPTNVFTKWATVEVSEYDAIPENMETLDLHGGLYAVFKYKGLAKDFGKLMQYVYGEWIPKSDYQLDNRPHFNVLGDKYKHNHPDSEEEVWVPVKLK